MQPHSLRFEMVDLHAQMLDTSHAGAYDTDVIYTEQALIEAAHGAARSKNTYLGAYYQQLKKRMGSKKAIVALAHHILLKVQQSYRELGPDHSDEQAVQSSKCWAIRRLEQLGFAVTLTPKEREEVVA